MWNSIESFKYAQAIRRSENENENIFDRMKLALDNATYVRFHPTVDKVYVWYGGEIITVFNPKDWSTIEIISISFSFENLTYGHKAMNVFNLIEKKTLDL